MIIVRCTPDPLIDFSTIFFFSIYLTASGLFFKYDNYCFTTINIIIIVLSIRTAVVCLLCQHSFLRARTGSETQPQPTGLRAVVHLRGLALPSGQGFQSSEAFVGWG